MRTRVGIIGSGFSGLCVGIKLREAGIDDFTIFEKADRVGGTWRDNTYPGAACDTPAMAYCFSFEPKSDWSRKWAEQSEQMFAFVLRHVPDGPTRRGLERAASMLHAGASVIQVAGELGSGQAVVSSDTVPFSLFCAAARVGRYEEAIWTTLEGLGDRDTTCAIVGGIVASGTGVDGIPRDWRVRREPLESP